MAEPVKFRGVVTFQRYYNEDSFWGVFNVRTKENLPFSEEVNQPNAFEDDEDFEPHYIVCVAGKMQQLYVGSEYEFTATCEYSSKYKTWNYVPSTVTAIAPSSIEDTRFFLESILTENQVNVLLQEYPNIVQEIINGKDNVDTKKLKGIGDKTYANIKERIINNYVISDIISELQPYGVTLTAIKNLLKWEPQSAILKQKIKENPYCMTEAKGFGFQTVDKIALKRDPSLIDSSKRLIAFMKYYLNQAAESDGHTWVEMSQLKTGIIDQVPQCIDLFDKLVSLEEDGNFGGYFYIDNSKIGLSRYHDCEENTYKILKDLNRHKFLGKIDIESGVKKAEESLGYKLSQDQIDLVHQIENNNVVVFTGKAGCVDSETEFFNGISWKKISDYTVGDKVLQWNKNGTAELVNPIAYVKKPCDYMYHFTTKYGVDQCLSPDHNCCWVSYKGKFYEGSMQSIVDAQNTDTGFTGKFITSFRYSGRGIDLSDAMIRIYVAVIADGSFYNSATENRPSYNRVRFHLKKERKKRRLLELVQEANIEVRIVDSTADGYTDYYIDVPFRTKEFLDEWYQCTNHQLQIIAEESLLWDGCKGKGARTGKISTTIKKNADFLQFAFSSIGYKTSILIGDRSGQEYLTSNKKYTRKSCEYTITPSVRNTVGLSRPHDHGETTKFEKYIPQDGLQYCFIVPSHFLVLRRNNKIFITGNCGKTSSAKAILNSFPNSSIACCSLSAKAAQRIQEATGFKAMTIHRLLEYGLGGFVRDAKNRLTQDVIFLDEASMVNCTLFYHLVSAIKEGAKLIICGDYAQLPPIGSGNVFTDILHMDGEFNVSVLKKVHRQAESSGILTDANKIRDGIYPIDGPKPQIINGELKDMAYVFRDDQYRIQDIVVDQFMKIKEKYGLDSVAIAVPRKDTVVNSSLEINKQIQMKVIDTKHTEYIQGVTNKFYIGDRILQTENDGKRDIYNGEVGYVEKVNPHAKNDEVCMVARFKSTINGEDKIIEYNREQLKSVLLSYAMSVHKLQGSEYDYIIVALDTSHYILLDRCMLYTAITRAKKMCILVSQPEAFRRAMKINKVNNRQTWLSLKYEEEVSA